MNLSARIVNKKAQECIEHVRTHNGDQWAWNAFETRPCDPNKDTQSFVFHGNTNDIKAHGLGGVNEWVTITRANNLEGNKPTDVRSGDWNTSLASRKFRYYTHTGDPTDNTIINRGPFKIGSESHREYRLHLEDSNGIPAEIVRHFENQSSGEGNDRQLFLNYNLWKICVDRGINFEDCTKENIENCSLPQNQGIFQNCPKEYCSKEENISKSECRTWCNTNPGACDETAVEFCKKNPDDPFCACFGEMPNSEYANRLKEKGIVLRRECNYAPCAIGNSYKTRAMLSQTCSPITACITGIDIGSIGGNADIKDVTNNCSITQNTSTTTSSSNTPSPSSSSKPLPTIDDEIMGLPKTTFFIIIGILGFIVFLIIILLLM
jgi:hypothetical protein